MLLPYKSPKHPIYKAQSFINHVVIDVLCKPQMANIFSVNIVDPIYRDMIMEINHDYILTPLSNSFEICKNKLTKKQLKVLKTAVLNNNRIRELCRGEVHPVFYEQIEILDSDLAKYIKTFCDSMYNQVLKLEPFYSIFGKIGEYYKLLVGNDLTCRFCGIGDILGEMHSKRSALDHYFPKGTYPFSVINLKNLIPICEICNSKYKLEQNPIRTKKIKQGRKFTGNKSVKAFYPFSTIIPDIAITVQLKKAYGKSIGNKDVEIKFASVGFEEEVETWDRLFGITENYTAYCCSNDMYNYVEQEYTALKNFGVSHNDYMQMLAKNLYSNKNVIKKPFLECLQVSKPAGVL